uniref:Uncharacterized protein n=1 Tax=Vespula pensylvanica TaxID=30213 RepID=A0A834PGD9_VESPE|nr:hypothetical protein H0235_001441 [Vespula pensylvanica]
MQFGRRAEEQRTESKPPKLDPRDALIPNLAPQRVNSPLSASTIPDATPERYKVEGRRNDGDDDDDDDEEEEEDEEGEEDEEDEDNKDEDGARSLPAASTMHLPPLILRRERISFYPTRFSSGLLLGVEEKSNTPSNQRTAPSPLNFAVSVSARSSGIGSEEEDEKEEGGEEEDEKEEREEEEGRGREGERGERDNCERELACLQGPRSLLPTPWTIVDESGHVAAAAAAAAAAATTTTTTTPRDTLQLPYPLIYISNYSPRERDPDIDSRVTV